MLMIRILNLNLDSINGLIEPDFSDPVYKKGICRVWILKKNNTYIEAFQDFF